MDHDDESGRPTTHFEEEAERAPQGMLVELIEFLRENKRWWLAPIILMLLFVAALVMLGGTVAAPFIYPLF